jgi:hypothetical protein
LFFHDVYGKVSTLAGYLLAPHEGKQKKSESLNVTFFMDQKILKPRHLAKMYRYHVKSICRLQRQGKIVGNRANPGGKQTWWIDDEKIRRSMESLRKERQLPHYLTFVNHFARCDRKVRTGQIVAPPIDIMRYELGPTLCRMVELLGKDWFLKEI